MLNRNKTTIKLCEKKISQTNGVYYEQPRSLSINICDVSSDMLFAITGQRDKAYKKAIVTKAVGELFKQGDRCYIEKAAPVVFDILCNDADFVVNSIIKTQYNTEILFEGLL